MKKFLVLLMALTIIFTFCSCADKSDSDNNNIDSMVEVDKKLLDVTVNLPAYMFSDETEEEIIAAAKEEGYKSCVVNEDGSVTYVMSKSHYNERIQEMKDRVAEGCAEKISDTGDYKYITDIKYNDDFSEFKIYIDTDVAENLDFFTTVELLLTARYYQSFVGYPADKVDTRIITLNDASGEEINSLSLKEWFAAVNSETTTEDAE